MKFTESYLSVVALWLDLSSDQKKWEVVGVRKLSQWSEQSERLSNVKRRFSDCWHLHANASASGVDGTPQSPREREKRQTVSEDFTDCLSIQSLSEWNGKKTKNELWRITNFSPFHVGFSSKTSELPWFRNEWESAIERWIASRRENDSIAINNFYLRHRRRFVRPTQHNPPIPLRTTTQSRDRERKISFPS